MKGASCSFVQPGAGAQETTLFCFCPLFFYFPRYLPHHIGEELMEGRAPANGAAGGTGFSCYSQFQGQDGVRGASSQNPALLSDGMSHAE